LVKENIGVNNTEPIKEDFGQSQPKDVIRVSSVSLPGKIVLYGTLEQPLKQDFTQASAGGLIQNVNLVKYHRSQTINMLKYRSGQLVTMKYEKGLETASSRLHSRSIFCASGSQCRS